MLLAATPAGAEYFPPPELSGGWRRLTPPSDAPTLRQKQFIRRIAGLEWDLLDEAWNSTSKFGGSLIVIRNGWIAGEWGTSTVVTSIASCTKTVTALTFQRIFDGSANGSFRTTIGLEDPAYQYLPASWGSDPARRTISIRHLLTMSSGLVPDDSPPSPGSDMSGYLRKIRSPPVAETPGSVWIYASLPVDTLSLVAESVTGSRLGDYFQQHIGNRIGVRTFRWGALGPHSYASAYARTTARDLARIGYLLLRRGTWNGQSVVSAAGIDEMTRWDSHLAGATYGIQVKFPTDPESQLRYGHLTWTNSNGSPFVGEAVPTDAFYCAGFRTKFVLVVPSLDLVVVRLENTPAPWSDDAFTDLTTAVMRAVMTPADTGSASVWPRSLTFRRVVVGTAMTKTTTVVNLEPRALRIDSIRVTGRDRSEFGIEQDCGRSIAVGGSCVARIRHQPASTGPKSASLLIDFGDGARSVSIPLTGSRT